MTVRAKFKVTKIVKEEGSDFIVLKPVVNGSEENKKFFKYTPSGEISISTINEDVVEQFNIGQEFYIDFTPA